MFVSVCLCVCGQVQHSQQQTGSLWGAGDAGWQLSLKPSAHHQRVTVHASPVWSFSLQGVWCNYSLTIFVAIYSYSCYTSNVKLTPVSFSVSASCREPISLRFCRAEERRSHMLHECCVPAALHAARSARGTWFLDVLYFLYLPECLCTLSSRPWI